MVAISSSNSTWDGSGFSFFISPTDSDRQFTRKILDSSTREKAGFDAAGMENLRSVGRLVSFHQFLDNGGPISFFPMVWVHVNHHVHSPVEIGARVSPPNDTSIDITGNRGRAVHVGVVVIVIFNGSSHATGVFPHQFEELPLRVWMEVLPITAFYSHHSSSGKV